MSDSSVHERVPEGRAGDRWLSRHDSRPQPVLRTSGRPASNVLRDLLSLEGPVRVPRWRIYARLFHLAYYFLLWRLTKQRDRFVRQPERDPWLQWWENKRTAEGKPIPGLLTLPAEERRTAFLRLKAAVRLREYLQHLGGTLVKIGQQASLRKDLLPDEYCEELEELFDDVPEFKVEVAYRAIERQTGKPWKETFRCFDEAPVGAASIACVYRAVLHNGDTVAVKVRRPDIRREFSVDLAALERVAKFLEFLMMVPPNLLDSFISEAKAMLFEELDFPTEIRYQELFRRYIHKRKKLNVTAPRLYHKLCGREVIVSEFVEGFWLKELTTRLVAGDAQYLARLHDVGIHPGKVAHRLVRSQYYQFHECPFFHGDPHPGNILVQPGGRIVMVDFGACGVFSGRDRNLMLQMHYYYTLGDVAGMVRCVVGLMEPTPNIDIDAFSKHLQDEWWKGYYGIKSKHADWSERTSFRLWIAMLRSFRKFSLPMPLHMLRMVRATLLYDTVAAQLDAKINVFKQFEKYYRGVERRARVDIQECLIRQALLGPDNSVYLKIQRIVNVANAALFRVEKFLSEPEISFEGIVNKIYLFIGEAIQMVWTVLMSTLAMAAAALGIMWWRANKSTDVLSLGYVWDRVTNPHTTGWVFIILWFIWLAFTMYSHGSRTMDHFRRKDDYLTQRRVV